MCVSCNSSCLKESSRPPTFISTLFSSVLLECVRMSPISSIGPLIHLAAKTGWHSWPAFLKKMGRVINILQTAPDLLWSQYYYFFSLQKARLVRGEWWLTEELRLFFPHVNASIRLPISPSTLIIISFGSLRTYKWAHCPWRKRLLYGLCRCRYKEVARDTLHNLSRPKIPSLCLCAFALFDCWGHFIWNPVCGAELKRKLAPSLFTVQSSFSGLIL